MDLSKSIVKQFAEIVGDGETPSNGTTVYGTIVEANGTRCVRIDGSDEVTPISTAVSIAPGERVLVLLKNHTATVTGNVSDPSASARRLEDAEGNISEISRTAEEIKQTVKNVQGDMSEIRQTAEEISLKVEGYDETIAEIKQTAGEITSKVEKMEEEFTQISQTSNEVKITATDAKGTLTTTIDAGTWEAIYKTISGKVNSGFYFDFVKGQFVYEGTGIFRSSDNKAYIKIENDGLTLYTVGNNGAELPKIHIGVLTVTEGDYQGDFPYVQLGSGGVDSEASAGLIKKFWDGIFIGNAYAKADAGPFIPKESYAGIFIDTKNGETYVVRGNEKQNIYTGAAIAKFR